GRDSRPGNGAVLDGRDDFGEPRSTRAGTRVPATGGRALRRRAGRQGRSTRAGTRVPATGSELAGRSMVYAPSLNEGRDSRPGNGAVLDGRDDCGEPRSTRAGTRVPATGGRALRRRAGRQGRSTRAGTRVPATGSELAGRSMVYAPSLNEGRDSRPGNGFTR